MTPLYVTSSRAGLNDHHGRLRSMSLHAPAGSLETVEAYGDGPFNTPQNEWADTDDDEGAASPNTISDISPVSFAIDPALLARSLSTLGAVRSAIGYDGSDIAAISPLFDKLEHPPPMAPPRLRRRGDSQISASVSGLQEIPEADELLIGDEDHDADDEAFTNDNYSAKESLTGSAGKRSRSVSFSGSNASSCTWADPVNESPIIPEHLRGPAFNADFERMMLDLPLPPMDSVPIVRTRARTLSSSGTEGTRPRIKLNDGPQETGFEKFRGHVKKKAKVLLNACHGNDAE